MANWWKLCSREAILCDYKDVFEGLGCMLQEYHIEIQLDDTPAIHPPCKVPFSLHGKLMETLARWRKVVSFLRWINPQTGWIALWSLRKRKEASTNVWTPVTWTKLLNVSTTKSQLLMKLRPSSAVRKCFQYFTRKMAFGKSHWIKKPHFFAPSILLLDIIAS